MAKKGQQYCGHHLENNKDGRPIKKIDFDLVERLAEIQCTGEEIAGVLNIDYDTLCSRIEEKYNQSFSEYHEDKKGKGKSSLRRLQWKGAKSGNATMLVWLGKQYLGQKDKNELSGSIKNINVGFDE